MVESLFKIGFRDLELSEESQFHHKEPEFRRCLRFANSFMDNSAESDDFCLDFIYGSREDNTSWRESISALWESLSMILFLAFTGSFYYYLIFVMKGKKEDEEKDHNHHFD